MGTLTALAFSLATPIFGFALSPPALGISAATPTMSVSTAPLAMIEGAASAGAKGGSTSNPPIVAPMSNESELGSEPALPQDEYVLQLKQRAKIAKIHRTLGIATWAATAVATIAGTMQYRNLYGAPFATELKDTPCVKGDAWPSQDHCSGTPWFHAITGFTAGGLYFSTMTLAIIMPDPDKASVGDSQFAKTVRMHKLLRWVHLAGMISQMVLGTIIANPGISGLDRSNDYDTLKMLSGVHLATGYVTLGGLSYAGAIMLF